MSSSTPRKRRRGDENAYTPARAPTTPRDTSCTPLTARQPSQASVSTPVNSQLFSFVATPLARYPIQTPLPSPIAQSLSFCDGFTPPAPLKKRLSARQTAPEDVDKLRKDYALKEEERMAKEREIAEQKKQAHSTEQVNSVLRVIRENGLAVHEFFHKFITTRDPSLSSQASKMLLNHGPAIFDAARERQPKVANDWALSTVRQLIAQQSEVLAAHFRPRQGSSVTEILRGFSLKEFLWDAERIAPAVYQTLRQIGVGQNSESSKHKDRELILATVLCMLVIGTP